MKRKTSLLVLSVLILLPVIINAQNKKTVTDYLGIPGPVTFDNKAYLLTWSSHPSATFYKQEYLPAAETVDKFKTMLLVDVITGDKNAKDIMLAKVEELKQQKLTNPMINYNVFNNDANGEYMIDFLLTANKQDGSISIIERNIYRYKQLPGKKGILLFGVSKRGYDKEVDSFLKNMKTNKSELVNAVAKFILPQINIKE